MTQETNQDDLATLRAALDPFYARCLAAFRRLFDLARDKEEVQYAMALTPEFRGAQDVGWSTASEAHRTLEDYQELLKLTPPDTPLRVRIGLSLYSHLAEAAGFYEVPKNMMRIASGDDYNLWPFKPLVVKHASSGERIAPNATKVMKDLLGHASSLRLDDFRDIILETFDFDVRNGYAHADYVIWSDGLRLPKRNGGQPKIVPFHELGVRVNKSIYLFSALTETIELSMKAYETPKRTQGRMNSRDPVMPAIISYNEDGFSIRLGFGL
jgi:hypothetical protein